MSDPPASAFSETSTFMGKTLESEVVPGARNPYLKLLTGPMAGKVYKLEMEKTHLGRAPENEVTLDDPGVSRVHARLTRGFDGAVLLTDLKSTNGTYVAGRRVTQYLLAEGDQIALGESVRLKFGYLDALEERVEERLFEKATRDALTGAINRASFLERLREEVGHARARGLNLSIALSDLDFFKKINDTCGHPAGDAVLVEFVRRAQRTLRGRDVLGRLGGEEFGFLLPECSAAKAVEVLERVRQAVGSVEFLVPVPGGTERITVTMSAGITACTGALGENEESLLAAADEALYEAKRTGRDRVVVVERLAATGEAMVRDTLELQLKQKRQLTRVACQLPVTVLEGEQPRPAVMLDMSVGGMRLELSGPADPPAPGAELEVALHEQEPTARVRVQWSRSPEIGVAYLPGVVEGSWVGGALQRLGLEEGAHLERRAQVRVAADLPVEIVAAHGRLEGRLRNLGLRGMLIETSMPVHPGLQLQATLGPLNDHPPLVCTGEVVRCVTQPDGERFSWGIAFATPAAGEAELLSGYVLDLLRGNG